ncbi:MAG: hypothetical protein ACR2RE_08915 [Geminicoccaceae bacterium]
MTKRADGKFERRERDFYATPPKPIIKLLPFLSDCSVFAEPMCGDGAIVRLLEARGWRCGAIFDIEPRGEMVGRAGVCDVFDLTEDFFSGCDHIISNPPWPAKHQKGDPTVSIVRHLMAMRPTWMLLSADFAHTDYARPLLRHCIEIVSVGRVSWMGNGQSGYDNAAWYLFDAERTGPPRFHGYDTPKPIFHPDIAKLL